MESLALYMVWNDTLDTPHYSYYWAENEDQAKQEFIKQIHSDADIDEIGVQRVWANNTDIGLRGYVVREYEQD